MFLNKISKLSTLFIFLWLIIVCADSGIIEGGKFYNSEKNSVHAFYLLDYISRDKVKEHSLKLIDESKGLSASFYFSQTIDKTIQLYRIQLFRIVQVWLVLFWHTAQIKINTRWKKSLSTC